MFQNKNMRERERRGESICWKKFANLLASLCCSLAISSISHLDLSPGSVTFFSLFSLPPPHKHTSAATAPYIVNIAALPLSSSSSSSAIKYYYAKLVQSSVSESRICLSPAVLVNFCLKLCQATMDLATVVNLSFSVAIRHL